MIYILHDNINWLSTLKEILDNKSIKYTEWFFGKNTNILKLIDLEKDPPEGVFYNRVSASSHTRGARYSLEYNKIVIGWLECHGRKVINGSKSLELELSKGKQYLELWKSGIQVPKTYFASNSKQILEFSEKYFENSCIIKDNRSGSGIGVKKINSRDELVENLLSSEYKAPIDGITLIQQYIEAPDANITRLEFINGLLVYAIKIDTSDGFNLCPADGCKRLTKTKFVIDKDFNEPELVLRLCELLKRNEIKVCGIEIIRDNNNSIFVYDINCNTNYNKTMEEDANIPLKATNKLIELLIE